MTLVVEDGSIVANANAYNSEADIVTWAAIFGTTMTTGEAEQFAQQARPYLDTRGYQGTQVAFGVQSLPFPRDGVYIEGNLLPNDSIPTQMKNAEKELCRLLKEGYNPLDVVSNENSIKREKFDVFETEYFEGAADTPILRSLSVWLDPMLDTGGAGGVYFPVDRSYG
jgi:hypothetical protein